MASDKHDKKRKRDSDRHDRPSKKPALNLQHLPPLAASVVNDDSELAPVIGRYLPFLSTLNQALSSIPSLNFI